MSADIISVIGMLAAIVLLVVLVMRNVNLFIVAIAASVLVAITGRLNLYEALSSEYMTGFVGFLKTNFLIFVAGGILGKIYEITFGAKAIARMIVKYAGVKGAAISVPLAVGILTYGGIAGFVACFAVFPIAIEIYREADIPRRFIPGAIIFGACTFTGVAPGCPNVGNNVMVKNLGTSLMASATVGFICCAIILVLGLIILNIMIGKAKAAGEHFVPLPSDKFNDDAEMPNGWLALIPLIFILITVNVKINGSTILPIEFGVIVGAVLAYVLMRKYHTDGISIMTHLTTGIRNAITATCNTSSIVAFGSVVKAACGFGLVIEALTSIPGPDLISASIAANLMAGICGSGSGGLGIAVPILAPIYAARGMSYEVMHRMMLIASSGLDSLPHNGFVVTVIDGVCNETHKTSYVPTFWLTVFVPVIATIVGIILFSIFPNLP